MWHPHRAAGERTTTAGVTAVSPSRAHRYGAWQVQERRRAVSDTGLMSPRGSRPCVWRAGESPSGICQRSRGRAHHPAPGGGCRAHQDRKRTRHCKKKRERSAHLVQEQDERRLREKPVRAHFAPERDRVLEAVHLRVLLERQVERERREEDDRLHVVKVRDPVLPLSACGPGLAAAGWWGSAGRTQLREPPTS